MWLSSRVAGRTKMLLSPIANVRAPLSSIIYDIRMTEQQNLTRRVIYELVWSKPMTEVAEGFGISDVALKKICKKHRIPTPSRGYWAKKKVSKPVKQMPLHDTSDPQDEYIAIRGARTFLSAEILEVLDQERQRRIKRKSSVPMESAGERSVQNVHQSIIATARALRKLKPGKGDVAHAIGQNLCGIEIGAARVERVIGILDTIARTLEVRGLNIEPAGNCMRVSVGLDVVAISLIERIEKRKHVPNIEELAREKKLQEKEKRDGRLGLWSFGRERAYSEYDFIRTGELNVHIADQYVSGLRRSWKDGKRQRIETLIDDIVSGIITYIAGVKAKHAENERRQLERRRHEHLRALARARDERESQRRKFLQRIIEISAEADELQLFVDRIGPRLPKCNSSELLRMVEWVKSLLQRIENELKPDQISAALRDKNLFPEADDLSGPEEGI